MQGGDRLSSVERGRGRQGGCTWSICQAKEMAVRSLVTARGHGLCVCTRFVLDFRITREVRRSLDARAAATQLRFSHCPPSLVTSFM